MERVELRDWVRGYGEQERVEEIKGLIYEIIEEMVF